jgi:hypothetical protein
MRVKFTGFGPNLNTFILAVIFATLLAGALTLIKPVVVPGHGGEADAAVYPCVPHAWAYKTVSNYHGGIGWAVQVKAQIKYNGCDVAAVTGSEHCLYSAFGFSVAFQWCGAYRNYTSIAYAQELVIGSQFQVYVGWQGFPLSVPVHMCQWYDRNGRLFSTQNGPYGPGC